MNVHRFRCPYLSRAGGAATALSLVLLAAGCDAGETSNSAECGGFGTMHGDHCHCDAGFFVSADGLTCGTTPTTRGEDTSTGTEGTSEGGQDADTSATGNTQPTEDEANPGVETGGDTAVTEMSFAPTFIRGSTGLAVDGSQIWLLEAVDGNAMLTVEIYAAYGGINGPGVAPITAVETDYASCGTCLVLKTGCVLHGDHYDCTATFMPKIGGELQVDAMTSNVGTPFTGEMLGIAFQQVAIGAQYQTQPIANGPEIHIDAWAFNVLLEPLEGTAGTGAAPCGGHGQPHGDHCDCDPGYMPNPIDPMDCIAY